MKTYKLITKPYRIECKVNNHTLAHVLYSSRFITFKQGTKMWCCVVKSNDHTRGESLMVFNHSFITTFTRSSKTLPLKWKIIDSTEDWKQDLSVLCASYKSMKIENFQE